MFTLFWTVKRQMHVALEGMRPKERAASPLLMVQVSKLHATLTG